MIEILCWPGIRLASGDAKAHLARSLEARGGERVFKKAGPAGVVNVRSQERAFQRRGFLNGILKDEQPEAVRLGNFR